MGFFTLGNLLTLGIVALVLILYRHTDKNRRSMDIIRKQVDKYKGEIASFAEEKGAAVRDFGIALEVERKAAGELMRRLQTLTEQELSQKSQALAKIDERLKNYDSSMEELAAMAGRVQENLGRIRDESAFVENVGKQIGEAKAKLAFIEKNLGAVETRFEKENALALEKISGTLVASVRSTVSDLELSAGTVGRQVEEHRQAIDKIERTRAANIAKDTEAINKTLKDALEKAGARADKMEDAALVKLKEQAQERLLQLKAAWEEKIKSAQENVKTRLADIQEQLKSSREGWKAECAGIESRQKSYMEEWKKGVAELDSFAKQRQDEWKKDAVEFDSRVKQRDEEWKKDSAELKALAKQQREEWKKELAGLDVTAKQQQDEWQKDLTKLDAVAKQQQEEWKQDLAELDVIAKGQRDEWARLARDAEQNIIAASAKQLEEYKEAQSLEFKRLETLADDSARLETELRRLMQDAVDKANGDFSRFQEDSRRSREKSQAEFDSRLETLRVNLDSIESELAEIRNQARENVSEKLQIFQDDFASDLVKRSAAMETQLGAWQDRFTARLEEIARDGAEDRKQVELRVNAEQRKVIGEQGEKLTGELERLKAQTEAFEEGIREEMRAADDSRVSFKEQLSRDLEEARSSAVTEAQAQIGKYSLSMSETLKQNQRELEEQLREMAALTESRNAELETAAEAFRRNIQDWQGQHSAQMRDLDVSMEEARRRGREMAAENDERIAQTRSELDLIRKELSAQTKLFDQAGELKLDLERRIEDLKDDIERLNQRKTEITQVENQFIQIKRLEDDVNAKMTRFLSEKRRIEVMESDFNRLLLTSQAVEEKLAQVSSSDDTLEAVQLQLRRLEETMKETEEKYQRVERKGQILEETSDGISRNFKALQESESAVKKANEEIQHIFGEIETVRSSIGALATESEKALEASDKLSTLDSSLSHLEKRIAEMQVAREWLARAETEMQALDKDIRSQLRLTRNILNQEGAKTSADSRKSQSEGALSPRDREDIISLRRQGWNVEEIASAMKRSKGEVELVLEIGSRD